MGIPTAIPVVSGRAAVQDLSFYNSIACGRSTGTTLPDPEQREESGAAAPGGNGERADPKSVDHYPEQETSEAGCAARAGAPRRPLRRP